MTKTEFIKDMIEFYSADPKRRSVKIITKDDHIYEIPMFKGPGGNECPFQRVVETDLSIYDGIANDSFERMFQAVDYNDPFQNVNRYFLVTAILAIHRLNPEGFPLVFKEPYRGHEYDLKLWMDILFIHDWQNFWDENGLSKRGKEYVDDILEMWEGK